MDASGQIRHDHAGGQFRLAWPAGRRGGRGRRPPQEESAGLADEVQFGKKAVADLSGGRGMVRFRTPGVSGRDIRAHRAWRKAMGNLIGWLPVQPVGQLVCGSVTEQPGSGRALLSRGERSWLPGLRSRCRQRGHRPCKDQGCDDRSDIRLLKARTSIEERERGILGESTHVAGLAPFARGIEPGGSAKPNIRHSWKGGCRQQATSHRTWQKAMEQADRLNVIRNSEGIFAMHNSKLCRVAAKNAPEY